MEKHILKSDATISDRLLIGLHAHVKYSGYLKREMLEIEKMKKFQSMVIPSLFNYESMPGLTMELQEKLIRFKPQTVAQAQLIPGMTPAAISLLIFQVRIAEK
jgi:tRNA uridine 5-carboxymethylaminomethyl modification enzyme